MDGRREAETAASPVDRLAGGWGGVLCLCLYIYAPEISRSIQDDLPLKLPKDVLEKTDVACNARKILKMTRRGESDVYISAETLGKKHAANRETLHFIGSSNCLRRSCRT